MEEIYFKDRIEDLAAFYQDLFKINSIQNLIRCKLGEELLNKINSTSTRYLVSDELINLLEEFIENESSIIHEITALGDYGEFSIGIQNFGPIYWISASDFDSIKYFKSLQDAINCAELVFSEFL
jgi:hypothetical protein